MVSFMGVALLSTPLGGGGMGDACRTASMAASSRQSRPELLLTLTAETCPSGCKMNRTKTCPSRRWELAQMDQPVWSWAAR
jgi:hypothetical protein